MTFRIITRNGTSLGDHRASPPSPHEGATRFGILPRKHRTPAKKNDKGFEFIWSL